MDQLMDRAVSALRRANDGIAIAAGLALLCTALFILTDIALRQLAEESFGGTDEISGYMMAITTSWAMGYALTQLAHVRIDLVRTQLPSLGRAMMDVFALWILAATAIFIALRTWPVLERSLRLESTANTPLATPLWIPQSLWFAGWLWFAVCASILALAVLWYTLRGQTDKAEEAGGVGAEL